MDRVPQHLGIIMDGNRRFAKRPMLKPWMGHEWGAKKLSKVLEWCQEYQIQELTLYTFSIQNFDRPKEEFDFLMENFRQHFSKLKDDHRIMEKGIRINVIGRIGMFPEDIQKMMNAIMDKTKGNSKYIINFAMAYGGREEVLDAVKRMGEQIREGKLDVAKINEEVFKDYLYLKDEPDLIIRTGGEKRTSNFLIWQSNYSEWMFVDKMWPEFEKEDFELCLKDYSERKRRFGSRIT